MSKILGLDVGTNSIGWALIDMVRKTIIDCGVRIFPEGVNRDTKGAEISRNATRTEKRQLRRLYFRKRLRKFKLVKLLIELGMFPDIETIFEEHKTSIKPSTGNQREKLFFLLNQVNLDERLREFFALSPYELRARGIKGERLTLYELGRVFYQLSQRRGYKESLQNALDDGKVLSKGKPEAGTLGIDHTKAIIQEKGSLGAAMFDLYQSNVTYSSGGNCDVLPQRIRNRYTLRSMYVEEFEKLWEAQRKFYPELLNDDLKSVIGDEKAGVLFFQRPLRNQKSLIGTCTFENGKPKGRTSSIWFEKFRMYQFINTIFVDGMPLSEKQKVDVIEIFNSKDKFEFGEIANKLKLGTARYNYESKQKVIGNRTIAGLRKIFGRAVWDAMTEEQQDHVWQIKINAADPFKTRQYLQRKWGFSEKQMKQFFDLLLSKDYASLSTTAIRNILPFLQKGYLYNEAVLLAGVKNAFGKEKWKLLSTEEQVTIEDTVSNLIVRDKGAKIQDRIKEFLLNTYHLSGKQLNKLYRFSEVEKIETTGAFPDSDTAIGKVKNPVVMTALFELRKVVTQVIKEYGNPDEVRIELARELKVGKAKREEMRFRQWDNEKANDDAKKELDRYNKPHTRINIRKILLYKELEKVAGHAVNPYNPSQTFNISRLFDDGYVQLEHIVPYSVSLDDSINNLTLCDAKTNIEKGDRTPFQYFRTIGNNWEDIKANIFKILPYQKAKKFITENDFALDDFIQRQLNDTRYIAKFAKEYLKYVCPKVYITQGGVTAQLRHLWGLDSILNKIYPLKSDLRGEYCGAVDETGCLIQSSLRKWTWSEGNKVNRQNEEDLKKMGKMVWGNARDGKFYPFKTRDDHRHHAIDAVTIACTKTAFLQEISRLNARVVYNEYIQRIVDFPEPWPGFYQEVRRKVSNVLVSYKKNKRVLTKTRKNLLDKKTGRPLVIQGKRIVGEGMAARGELHEATYYGKRKAPDQEKAGYHIRKRLDELTPAMIGKIVDADIRRIITEAIIKMSPNGEINVKDKIPPGVFFERKEDGTLLPKIFLPNKNGNPIPIYKVRIRENKSNAVQVKDFNIWVEPGSNHHIVLYDVGMKREGKVSPFWVAVERKQQGLSTIDKAIDGEFVMSLQKGDMILLGVDEALNDKEINELPDLFDKLFYLRKFSQSEREGGKGHNIQMIFVHHSVSNINPDRERKRKEVQSKSPATFKNAIKVEVSPLGKLKRVQ